MWVRGSDVGAWGLLGQAAILGLGSEAGRLVLARFRGPTSRFPGFFRMHFDYTPEVDTGAVAKLALQVT